MASGGHFDSPHRQVGSHNLNRSPIDVSLPSGIVVVAQHQYPVFSTIRGYFYVVASVFDYAYGASPAPRSSRCSCGSLIASARRKEFLRNDDRGAGVQQRATSECRQRFRLGLALNYVFSEECPGKSPSVLIQR